PRTSSSMSSSASIGWSEAALCPATGLGSVWSRLLPVSMALASHYLTIGRDYKSSCNFCCWMGSGEITASVLVAWHERDEHPDSTAVRLVSVEAELCSQKTFLGARFQPQAQRYDHRAE